METCFDTGFFNRLGGRKMGKIAFLFAGQGAQSVGMGKDLYDNNAAAKAVFDMGEALRPGTEAMCFEGPGEALTQTENTQPCLFLTDLACARALEAAGVKADMAAGFSLGEIPALAFAGVLSDEDAFKLVTLRGEKMSECAAKHPGSMVAALKLDNAKVEEVCAGFKNVYPVNYNCPGQLSCAGAVEELDAFVDAIKAAGGRAVKLAVSGAFHTPFMAEATQALAEKLNDMKVSAPELTLYSNLTGEAYPSGKAEIIDTVSKQASNSVRWEKLVRDMAANGVDTFIEVGAGTTLSGLVKRTLTDVRVFNVCDMATLTETVKNVM